MRRVRRIPPIVAFLPRGIGELLVVVVCRLVSRWECDVELWNEGGSLFGVEFRSQRFRCCGL